MAAESEKKELASIKLSAMNILSGREHSVAELKQKLRRKFDGKLTEPNRLEELLAIILGQLIDDKLLDESRFTESFIRSRIAKGYGPVKIRHELMQRGIAVELSDNFLDDSDDFWQEQIETVRSKRFGIQQPGDYKEQSKQSRFLYQRGFSGELIRKLFNDL